MALFGFGKKKEKPSCCCNASYTPEAMERADTAKRSAGIQVLGGGCANCHQLEANVKGALAELGLDTPVELITDFAVIAAYGVLTTPALVVDGKVVSCGKVLKKQEIEAVLLKTPWISE